MAMAAMKMGATLKFLAVPRRMGMVSEAEKRCFLFSLKKSPDLGLEYENQRPARYIAVFKTALTHRS